MIVSRVDVHEASAHILAGVARLDTEFVPLSAALHRVLASGVVAPVSLPPWDNASMDGYAVQAADVGEARQESPARLRVVDAIAAGARPTRAIGRGEAVRIMTGAPVPAGADSVVRVEDTDGGTDVVCILDGRDARRNIRRRGEDVMAGQTVLAPGTRLGPAHIGVLASVGGATIPAVRRPRVALLATGEELVTVEGFDSVRRGERIVSSNSYALEAAVREAGGDPLALGIVRDDPLALAAALRGAEGCDLIVTTGGVSAGEFDFTRDVVSELGGELSLWRVRMRPGAPLAFGRLFGVPWLGLPGNPVSALVTFELFGRPLVRLLEGQSAPHRRTLRVRCATEIATGAPLTHFLRATLENWEGELPRARLTGTQSSGALTSMAAADILLVVPPSPPIHPPGDVLLALPLSGEQGSAHFLA